MDTTTALFKVLKRMEEHELVLPEFPVKLGKWSLVEVVDELHAVYADKKGNEEKVFVSEDSLNAYAKEYAVHEEYYKFSLSVSKWHRNAAIAVQKIEFAQKMQISKKMYGDGGKDFSYLHENCSGYYD